MHFLIKARMPVESGNALLRDPSFMQTLQGLMDDMKPEAVYFSIDDGQRTIYFAVDIPQASDMPKYAEPLWLATNADVTFIPFMDLKEFQAAGPGVIAAVQKYS